MSLAVSFTAITGYLVYTGSFDSGIIHLFAGVFILAGGASALNEYQERKYDAKMTRTMQRPLPKGLISPKLALFVSFVFIITGLLMLYFRFGSIVSFLGLFNVIWYNLLYTNLKRITSFAVIPGSLTGAVPVFIGWAAAGGNLLESKIIFIAFFLFIWQIPHFWLLMLKYGKEYENAGFPTINQIFGLHHLKRIILSWVIATSLSSLMIPLFDINISIRFFLVIFLLNILFVGFFIYLSFGKVKEISIKKSFISINIFMFIFMSLLTLYHLFSK